MAKLWRLALSEVTVEKRFVVFIISCVLFLTAYTFLIEKFAPPPPKKPVAEENADPKPDEDKPAPTPGDPQPVLKSPDEPAATPKPTPPRPAAKPQWSTLGSYRDSQFLLLATFNNQGATLERVELTERDSRGQLRYRNLEESHGYLGHLSPTDHEQSGARVNVVGAGTPAANAEPAKEADGVGLRVGDVLIEINDHPISQAIDVAKELQRTTPGQEAKLLVLRGGATKPIEYTAKLDTSPLDIIRPEPTVESNPLDVHPLSLRMSLEKLANQSPERGAKEFRKLPSLLNSHWEIVANSPPNVVEFRLVLDADSLSELGLKTELEIIKRFRLANIATDAAAAASAPAYHLDVEVEFRNTGAAATTASYRLEGPNGLPTEGWWYTTKIHTDWFAAAGARDVLWSMNGRGRKIRGARDVYDGAKRNNTSPERSLFAERASRDDRTLTYIGVDAAYFNASLLPGTREAPAQFVCEDIVTFPWGDIKEVEKRTALTNSTFRLSSERIELPAGKSHVDKFTLFVGPKRQELLNQYGLGDAIEFGWFGWVARPLARILHFFQRLVSNWGIAIVMLTVLVRGCMFPVSRKASRNAQMMQDLAPELKAIKEKYKDDLQKQGVAQRELFAKHNYNPFSGCLLVFLQLPIFIGLYRAVSTDIELRQAALLPGVKWCSNLAGPDMLARWDGWLMGYLSSETGWLGPYLNVLPFITVVLFLIQQKMFMPPATDEQTQMQQAMMKWMTIFMGLFFFKVPAGLCIYFVASSIWSICERKYFLKMPPPKSSSVPAPAADSNRPARRKRGK